MPPAARRPAPEIIWPVDSSSAAVVSSTPGRSTTSGAMSAARMPGPNPARSSRNTTSATMNAIPTVRSAP